MKETINGFERRLVFYPAYDRRSKNPKENFGIHGVEMTFLLIGPLGVTQFILSTNWQLPHVQKELDMRFVPDGFQPHGWCHPLPADLGYHSPTPRYGNQTRMECSLLDQGYCYYDGSGLRAQGVYVRLLNEGEEGVWAALEEEYQGVFIESPPQGDQGERRLMP